MSVRQGNNIIAIGNVAVDGDTVAFNGNASLEARGVMNKNIAAGATDKLYDWVGTIAEYTTQDVATNHPDWLCFITDDDASELLDTEWAGTLGYPDVTRAESVTPLASGSEYTAPKNGWFFTISAVSSANAYTYIRYSANTDDIFRYLEWKTTTGGGINVWCPVKAGEKVTINYSNATLSKVYFIPAYGQQ